MRPFLPRLRRLRVETLEQRRLLAAELSVTPITWDVIGMDHNDQTAGPDTFLIGARIENVGDQTATSLSATINLGDTVQDGGAGEWVSVGTHYIDVSSASSYTLADLAPGATVDVYFQATIDRASDAFDTARRYTIDAAAMDGGTPISASTPSPRQLYVEHLVSQNRNATTNITAPDTIEPGDTFSIIHDAKTATNGYEQLVSELTLPTDVFEILSVTTTYTADTSPIVPNPNDKIYADAAGWINDPVSPPPPEAINPLYNTVSGLGKVGGTTITTYDVRVRDTAPPGSYSLDGVIYDFSGSSYHYNSDYGVVFHTVTVTNGPAIGDFVWFDDSDDGIQDPGESGLAGITVNLYTSSDTFVASEVTGANGFYLIDQSDAPFGDGWYYLEFVIPPGATFSPQDQGGDEALDSDADPVTGQTGLFQIVGTAVNLDLDAGLNFIPVTISGTVWGDTDADSIEDNPESEVNGVTVQLFQRVAGVDTLVQTAVTAAMSGPDNYEFTSLLPADYFVRVLAPPGNAFSAKINDSDVNPFTGDSDLYTLDFGDTQDIDAGLIDDVEITGFVWDDTDRDGIQDAGESGFGGVTVRLLDDTDTEITNTLTNAAGNYEFLQLPAWTYLVEFVNPTWYILTLQDQGTDDVDSDADPATGRTASHVLLAGGAVDLDAGMIGVPDLTLSMDDGGITSFPGGTVIYTITYDNVGKQGATGVVITETLPANSTFDGASSTPGWVDAGGGIYTYTVGALGVGGGSTVDFAVTVDDPFAPGVTQIDNTASIADDGANGPDPIPGDNSDTDSTPIGNLVWHDLDGDGIQDAGEPGIKGTAVELFSSADGIVGNADDVSLGVEITDANGRCFFAGLTEGNNYYLQFRVPVGDPAYAFTTQDAFGDTMDAIDSDADPAGTTGIITLTGGDFGVGAGLVNGPAPDFGFALRAGGAGYEEAWGVATDADGNAYIVGSFEGTPDFDHGPGTYNLTSTGSVDAFVAKYSSTGALVWAQRMGGTDWDDGYGITLDGDDGSVYATGCFRGAAADFGTDVLASAGDEDIFVAKFNSSNGDFIWARRMGGTGWDDGYAITVDDDGDVYSTGYFRATADFDPGPGTYNLDSAGYGDVYISRLDKDGNFLGAQQMGGMNWEIGYGIAVDGAENVHIAGYFTSTADFDPDPSAVFELTSVSGSIGDVFVAKLDAAGDFLWAQRMGGAGWDYACGIAIAADGSVYTSGYFYETADFGLTNLISAGDADIFACKLDASGNFQWARRMGGSGYDAGFGMAVAGDGTIYTTGYFWDTVDFDPGAGTQNLTSAGLGDVFLSQLDSNGDFVSVGQMGGAGDDCGYGIAPADNGCIYAVGSFSGTADFNPDPALLETYNLISEGGSIDIFLSDPPWKEEDPPPETPDGSDNAGQEDAPPVVFGNAGGGTSDPEIAGGSDVLESDPPWQEEDDPPPEPADGSDNAGQDGAPAAVSGGAGGTSAPETPGGPYNAGGNDAPGNREAPLFESADTAGPDASAVEGRGYGADYQTYYFERLGADKRGNDQSALFDFDHLPSLEAASNRSSNAPLDLLYETLASDQVGDTAGGDAEEAVPFLGLVLQTVGNWQCV